MIKLINNNSKELLKRFKLCNYQRILFASRFVEKNEEASSETQSSSMPVQSKNPNEYEDIKIVSTKLQSKLPKREPLVKNFFLGKVDNDLLAFPEVVSRDSLAKLNDGLLGIRNYFKNEFDAETIEKTYCIPQSVRNELKNLNLFGLNVPESYDGKSYFWTESLIASEPETSSPSLSMVLVSHRLVCDILDTYGTPYQKDKYLSKLAQGILQGSEAIFESQITKNQFFNTTAAYDAIGKKWTINGEKSFIINGKNSNLYLVLAETKLFGEEDDGSRGITMFLIDSNTPGVKVENPLLSFGCRASEYYSIKFDNVNVSPDNVIGEVNNANVIGQALLKSSRLRSSVIGLGLCKNVANQLTKYCLETKHCGVSLNEMNISKNRIADITSKIYAIESMIYYTAGLMDEFDEQDVDAEAAITKLYTMENLREIACAGIEFMGPKMLLSGAEEELALRNAIQVYISGESIDSIKIFIGLSGLQYAGMNIYEDVNKERNPLFHPGHIFAKLLQNTNIDSITSKLGLKQNLHPSLEGAVHSLELSVERLKICTSTLLTRYGNEVLEQHKDIRRLTEMITLIYAMFTSLSRSSRAYCIGLQFSDNELLLATSICSSGCDRIKYLGNEIVNGPFVTNDKNLERLSKQIWNSKGYFPIHPITYNY